MLKKTLTAAVLATFVGSTAFAHQGATGIVKERMEAMSAMKDALAVIGRMLKGETGFDATQAVQAADAIAQHADEMRALFPDTPESRQKASEATPLEWEQPERFAQLAQELMNEASLLSDVAAAGKEAELLPRFRSVGKACTACHEDFRQNKS